MSWEKIPNINKDFILSHQQEEVQKTARERQEQERQTRLSQLKDKDEHEKIERLIAQRDKEALRAKQAEKEHQERRELRETQRRLDDQRNPRLTHQVLKSANGKSPDQVAREIREQNDQHKKQQIRQAEVKMEDFHNKGIDQSLKKALEKQQGQQRPEPSYLKDAEKSVRDRFDGAAQAKDWRQIQAERMRDEFENSR